MRQFALQCDRREAIPRLYVVYWLLQVVWLITTSCSQAQEAPDRSVQVKAAYLFQFIQYIQWPEQDGDFVIGVVGDDPVTDLLKKIAAERQAGTRMITVVSLVEKGQAEKCQMIFVPQAIGRDETLGFVKQVRTMPILLVGESTSFIPNGGVIQFVPVENRIRLRLSIQAAEQKGLKVSSKLAKVAEVVDTSMR